MRDYIRFMSILSIVVSPVLIGVTIYDKFQSMENEIESLESRVKMLSYVESLDSPIMTYVTDSTSPTIVTCSHVKLNKKVVIECIVQAQVMLKSEAILMASKFRIFQ